MFQPWSPKENKLEKQIVGMITRIQEINWESFAILKNLWETLTMYEETYDELSKTTSNEISDDEIILKAKNCIKVWWEFLSWGLKTISDENSSLLDKNNIFPMLIDATWGMILNYQIIISRINYLNK